METQFEDAMVSGHERLIGALALPDPDDRHVLAAAISDHADAIVTANPNGHPAECAATQLK